MWKVRVTSGYKVKIYTKRSYNKTCVCVKTGSVPFTFYICIVLRRICLLIGIAGTVSWTDLKCKWLQRL